MSAHHTNRAPEGTAPTTGVVGPILHHRGMAGDAVALVAILLVSDDRPDPELTVDAEPVPATTILKRGRWRVLRHALTLPQAPDAHYRVDGARYDVATDLSGDLAVAYASCNGQEHGDLERTLAERNLMWSRLADRHRTSPFHVLLHGGDQIYADEVLDAHPAARAWIKGRPGPDMDSEEALETLAERLRGAYFDRYLALFAQPQIAAVQSVIPTLSMWDDHDIVDGWGSLRPGQLDSPIGKTLFRIAREHFLVFQCGEAPDAVPPFALDPTGASLTWHIALPGLHILAPDLRSERRPDRVMGPAGWAALEKALSETGEGRVLILSSVPALGPRLSLLERLMHITKRMEKYEDDLRDQWQSYAHRDEWRRFLEALAAVHANPATPVTVLSGEIHLATRGTLHVQPAPLHQLVASGIAHPPPPRLFARALGLLARFGETPLEGRPIRLHPLPGYGPIYACERNYLTLARTNGEWSAAWDLEKAGRTPALPI